MRVRTAYSEDPVQAAPQGMHCLSQTFYKMITFYTVVFFFGSGELKTLISQFKHLFWVLI